MSQSPSVKLLNEKVLPANYAADKVIQRVIALVKIIIKPELDAYFHRGGKNFNRSQSTIDILYMDNRLVIPQSLRPMIICSSHLWPSGPRINVFNIRRYLVAAHPP